jgi:hypothetical protein
MNTEKAAAYLLKRIKGLKRDYEYLEEDALADGPMSYEYRERCDSARRERKWIIEQLAEIHEIMETTDENKR